MLDYDLLIIGGGVVGYTTALISANVGFKTALVAEPAAAHPSVTDALAPAALQIYAINLTNKQTLTQLAAWPAARYAPRIKPFTQVTLKMLPAFNSCSFKAEEAGLEALGFFIEAPLLLQSLWDRLTASSSRIAIWPKKLTTPPRRLAQHWLIEGVASSPLTARLLLGADGADSWLRQVLHLPTITTHYSDRCLVMSLQRQQPTDTCTWQHWLSATESVAYLPLFDEWASIIYYAPAPTISVLQRLTACQLKERLSSVQPLALSKDDHIRGVQAFSLQSGCTYSTADGILLVGDAAHTVHPMLGQGLNLSLSGLPTTLQQLYQSHRQKQSYWQRETLQRQQNRQIARYLSLQTIITGLRTLQQHPEFLEGGLGRLVGCLTLPKPLKTWLRQLATGS